MYSRVVDLLAGGGASAIFPEGGSHDRTDTLPLKVGVALIRYAALEKHDVSVPIVPVGLNYFRAHRFRGRVVVEVSARPASRRILTTHPCSTGTSRRPL